MVSGQNPVTISLSSFDFNNSDSLFKCQINSRYNDFVRYVNNMIDKSLDSETRLHSRLALWALLGDLNDQNSFEAGVIDESVEGNRSKLYKRSEYIDKVNEVSTLEFTYQKEFMANGCPNSTRSFTNTKKELEKSGEIYYAPLFHFGLDFIEKSIRSDSVISNLRKEKSIVYLNYLKSKSLKGNISKTINEEDFEYYREDYIRLTTEKIQYKSFDKRDTLKKNRLKVVIDSLKLLEENFVNIEFKISYVTEKNDVDIRDENRRIEDLSKECNCTIKVPQDDDGDGFNFIVDCDDTNPNVFPGARVNCNDSNLDDNCDGKIDICCDDLDGDGFVSGSNCDCFPYYAGVDLLKVCDCNDDDPTVFPGASINCENNFLDDNCDGKIDSIQIDVGKEIVFNTFEKMYPPWAMTRFGQDKKFYLYTGGILISGGIASFFKIRSNNFYKKYKNAETFRTQDTYYNQANKFHKGFIVSTGVTASIYILSHVDFSITFRKHKKTENEIKEKLKDCAYSPSLNLKPFSLINETIGPTLSLNF